VVVAVTEHDHHRDHERAVARLQLLSDLQWSRGDREQLLEARTDLARLRRTQDRLSLAREQSQAADSKSGHLLTAVGLLLAGGGLLAGSAHLTGPALLAAKAVIVAVAVAVLVLLDVLRARGGRASAWLTTGTESGTCTCGICSADRIGDAELVKVAGIVEAKHTRISVAVRLLQAAVVLAVLVGVVAG
jgi:hypothetical protein